MIDWFFIGFLVIGLFVTLLINRSLSKENKELNDRIVWKDRTDSDNDHSKWMELSFLRGQVSRLMADRVVNTVYAYVAFCDNQHFVGITTEAKNEREAYGYAHEKVKDKFGTDDMALNVYALWIPNINVPSQEEKKDT